MKRTASLALIALGFGTANLFAQTDDQVNLFNWRGPFQTGVSPEKYSDWAFEGEKSLLWTVPISGRGCPVIVDGRMYVFAYTGTTTDLRVLLLCMDPETGDIHWQKQYNDFLSDTVYNRYSIGSPTVDKETRNVYLMTEAGLFTCYDKDGKELWQHSMMESFGRLTFPNGRTGAPLIEGDLVIVRGITSFWGNQGPGRDRMYAFDKKTGEAVWASEPGLAPMDSAHGTPVIHTLDGKRVLYAGTGCGHVVAVNALTGQPLWRFPFSKGGISSTLAIHNNDKLIAIHGVENLDSTETGRMIGLKLPTDLIDPNEDQVVLDNSAELWRLPIGSFSSSPVLAGDRGYQIDATGNLHCIDLVNGKILWTEKLDSDNLHSSPLYVDGILYVPTNNGKFFVIRPSDEKAEILHSMELEGSCIGAPAVWKGHVYVHTTEKLYCFKLKTGDISYLEVPKEEALEMGDPNALAVIPNEMALRPGDKVPIRTYPIDINGVRGEAVESEFESFIPPTARVKSTLDAGFEGNTLVVPTDADNSAGVFKATSNGLIGFTRGRIFEQLPMSEDFEGYELTETRPSDNVAYAYPPLTWIGGRPKWEVRELEGNKVLTKTLDNVLFQRAMTFIGGADMSNYTIEADVMTDGGRRNTMMGDMGVINQRYLIALKGNWNEMEISSNHERLKESVSFPLKRNTWYTLKTRVDVNEDGSGVIRAKAWPKGEDEPEAWTMEVTHSTANLQGAPGIFGFTPQSQKHMYVDNIKLTPNE